MSFVCFVVKGITNFFPFGELVKEGIVRDCHWLLSLFFPALVKHMIWPRKPEVRSSEGQNDFLGRSEANSLESQNESLKLILKT